MSWRRLEADGCDWEVRVIASEGEAPEGGEAEEILEFSAIGAIRPPRRLLVMAGALEAMTDAELRAAHRQARPIGGDHYGRPGKRMIDSRGTE